MDIFFDLHIISPISCLVSKNRKYKSGTFASTLQFLLKFLVPVLGHLIHLLGVSKIIVSQIVVPRDVWIFSVLFLAAI